MRLSTAALLAVFSASAALAAPFDESGQIVFSNTELESFEDVINGLLGSSSVRETIEWEIEEAKDLVNDASAHFSKMQWFKDGSLRTFILKHGNTYELVSHPSFADYQLRVMEPTICDPDVQQYSGYLDISEDKHLFFWFFEAREDPENAPLILWLNGGPGCSSSTGLLFELGPCSIADEGNSLNYNNYSWNSNANIVFLDQPINVGFSYSSDGSTIDNSPAAGEDVYAFLELFLTRFPKYAHAPFHIAAESYGGTYAPNFANTIWKKNKELTLAPVPGIIKINLATIMIGNGMTDPYTQYASIPEFACDGPYPIYNDPDGPECNSLRSKIPTCQRLVDACYQYNNRLACVPASLYCGSQMYGPIQRSGLNPYDVRKTCNPKEDTSLCYKQMGWIDTWMNKPENKLAVGADPERTFESCNMQVNQAFLFQGDGSRNSAPLLTDLVNDGIRLLVYAGNADYMCNFIGNEEWVEKFDSDFTFDFAKSDKVPWKTLDSKKVVGSVRSAGTGAGNVTFVTVYEAGHMVPFDQPEAALDLLTRWIANSPLSE